jgi:hypothetical protein
MDKSSNKKLNKTHNYHGAGAVINARNFEVGEGGEIKKHRTTGPQ